MIDNNVGSGSDSSSRNHRNYSRNQNDLSVSQDSIPEKEYVPYGLYVRLSRRISAKYFSLCVYPLYLVLVVFGCLYCNAAYVNTPYIPSIVFPEAFYERTITHKNFSNLPIINTIIGVSLFYVGIFCLVNNSMMLLQIIYGGNKNRLKMMNVFTLAIQILVFIGSVVVLVLYNFSPVLGRYLFIFSLFNSFSAFIYFFVVKRCLEVTNNYHFLSIAIMEKHKNEVFEKYVEELNVRNGNINNNS